MPFLKYFLVAVAFLLTELGTCAQQFLPDAEQEIVRLVNAERAKAGLPALTVDERLTRIAREHSQLLLANRRLSHQFSGEPDLRHRVIASGLRFDASGENVGFDASAVLAHRSLMNSPPHRANILDPNFSVIGIGVVRSGDNIYVTQDFARRLVELSPDQAESLVIQGFADLRRSNGAKPLPLVRNNSLRELACHMAREDRLETDLARDIPNVRSVLVWTAAQPQKLPAEFDKLRTSRFSGWSLGACFASSNRYPNPVWWMVAVTYF